jgi:hypothetical protein
VARNDGTKLQDLLQGALTTYCKKHPGFAYRFPDTKAARGMYLPKQPGDFLLVVPRAAVLLECKSTVTGESVVALAKEDRGQLGKHALWHRAGQPSRYVYADLTEGRLDFFDGVDVLQACRNGSKTIPRLSGVIEDMHDLIMTTVRKL